MIYINSKKGIALILTFMVMTALTAITVGFLYMRSIQTVSSGRELASARAFWLAEAGLANAKWAITTGGEAVGWGASDVSLGEGTYTVTTVDNGDGTCTITSEGYIPDDTDPIARRRIVESSVPVDEPDNLSPGATPTASSESGGHPAEDAIDEDTDTKWAASAKNDAWFKLDFGDATTFERLVINGQKNINSVTIEYSNNDVDYSEVDNLSEDPAWTYTFDSVTARYLKLNMDVDSNKKAEIDELETYETAQSGLGQGEFTATW